MNNTATYISELLYRYECVILPGFGAFLTKREPATLHQETHTFYPPKKRISFNAQLQNNDGLLANYIASTENISYTDALAKIQRYVLSLQEKMNAGLRIKLSKIGDFYTSVENTLQFSPLEEENYLAEAFGLQPFVSPTIDREIEIKREVYKKEVEKMEERIPLAFTPEKRREHPYLKYAAVAVVVLGVAGFLGLKQINSSTTNYNALVWEKANKEIENRIQEATFEISSPLPAINLNINSSKEIINTAPISNVEQSKRYHIVAGAYRVKANANKKVRKLQSLGFNAKLIDVNKYGLHQVVYDSYENKAEATQALRDIRAKQSSRAWLLVLND